MNKILSRIDNQYQTFLRKWVLFTLISFCILNLNAQEVVRIDADRFDLSIISGDSLWVFEDSTQNLGLGEIMSQPFSKTFSGTDQPQGSYWMKFKLLNLTDYDQEIICFFDRTTKVDLYKISSEEDLFVAYSGNSRKKSELNPGDSRNHLVFKLKANVHSTFYINLQNGTDYLPDFSVWLQDTSTFLQKQQSRRTLDFSLLGAAFILVVYSLSLYIIHRYTPYLWLALHAFGFMMYSFALHDYFIEWFLPETPSLSGFITTPFSLLGHFGMLMLLLVFLNMKKGTRWYKILVGLSALTILQMIISMIMIGEYGLYVQMTLINLFIFLVNIVILVVMLFSLWKGMSRNQRIFSSGIIFFLAVVLMGVMSWFLLDDLGRSAVSITTSIGSLGQILIFAIALGFQMRQHEIDKNLALDDLNNVLFEQKKRIELKVIERTQEVNKQNVQLEERNDRIETLFKEVHHRVKNNLQLISSLLNMQQEWSSTEDPAKAIEDSRSRVVAMSMIHQFLYRTDDISSIYFKQYAEELASKLDDIQVERVNYQLHTDFDEDYNFGIDTSISLGLILNELITNSYKHAALDKRDLEINLKVVALNKDFFKMIYTDNGEEIKTPFKEVVKKGFGLRLASRLSRQLQGSFEYEYNNGNQFSVTFASEEARLAMADE